MTIFILPHHLGSHTPSSEDLPYQNGRKKQRCDPGCRIREEIGAMQSRAEHSGGAYVTIFILPHHLGSHTPSLEDFPYQNGRKKQWCDPGCRIREEIGAMQSSGRVQRDIETNTEKYLALALPPSHNQGQFWI